MPALALVLTLAALATPPGEVKYTLDQGDVTFDHAAHVARRERCKTCHGEGLARKVELGKDRAHVLCLGCHALGRAGPRGCFGCHAD